jgi:CHAT domain-containing protein
VRADLTPDEAAWEKQYREIGDRLTVEGVEFQKLLEKKERTADEEKRLFELDRDLETGRLAFQRVLGELSAEFGKTLSAPDRLANVEVSQTFQAALGELGPGAVALYTLVGEERYHVILVTAHAHKTAEYPIKAVDLNKKILAFREVLQSPNADPKPLARELYTILVAPIASALDGAKAETLMWSLDGTLRYLPVAALYDGEKYLVERYRNTLFTLASLNFLKDEPKGTWTVAGLGVSKATEGFRALASVPGEMAAIVREEGKTSGVLPGIVKLDEEFTEPAFRSSLLSRYPVIHIASHFAFQPGNETNSFLLLGGGVKTKLSVADIKGYSFAGVDLLTLSACDTATGSSADGREVDGLGMIAQKQGAKAVIATLWEVADESTGQLMAEFYRLRQTGSGMPKGEALRQAQLALLKGASVESAEGARRGVQVHGAREKQVAGFSHPYYWAPFILIGNWK